MSDAENKLKMQLASKNQLEGEASSKLQQASKEKEELLNLIMQRGKLIQVKLLINTKLQIYLHFTLRK